MHFSAPNGLGLIPMNPERVSILSNPPAPVPQYVPPSSRCFAIRHHPIAYLCVSLGNQSEWESSRSAPFDDGEGRSIVSSVPVPAAFEALPPTTGTFQQVM